MRPPGIIEIILILVIVFIIFGAGRLPQIFEFLGRTLRGVKKGKEFKEIKTTRKSKKKAVKG